MTLTTRRRLGALALGLAGPLFALYPILRPYSDETTLAGAGAMSSSSWVASHTFAMFAFMLLTAGTYLLVATSATRRRAAAGLAVAAVWLGTSLILPFYGAETFGLNVIGQRAAETGNAGLLELAEDFRFGTVPVSMFAAGLLLLGVGGVALGRVLWTSTRPGALILGAGLVLYLPQFFTTPAVRIGHGVLLAAGCLVVALIHARSTSGSEPASPLPGSPAGRAAQQRTARARRRRAAAAAG